MAVEIVLKSIEVERKSDGYGQRADRAIVTVGISQGGEPGLEMKFLEDGYASLNDVMEAVRLKLLGFAKELHAAAQNPLVGTQPSP
jgi:hypothetical protein